MDIFSNSVCPWGHFCLKGSDEPELCPSGTFNNRTGAKSADQCTPCPAGRLCFMALYMYICKVCPNGLLEARRPVENSAEAALKSKQGFKLPSIGKGQISSGRSGFTCPRKIGARRSFSGLERLRTRHSLQRLSMVVIHRADGSYLVACPPKSYCPESSVAPLPCPENFYCPGQTVEPVACPARHYCPEKSDTPQPCPSGLFCPGGSEKPFTCPAGTRVGSHLHEATSTALPLGCKCVLKSAQLVVSRSCSPLLFPQKRI